MKKQLIGLMLLLAPLVMAQSGIPELRFEGVRIWVNDLEAAEQFYTDVLGFELSPDQPLTQSKKLKTQSISLYLSQAAKPSNIDYEDHIRTGLTLQVPKLLPAIDRLRKAGIRFEEYHLQRNGVGISIPFRDPAGNLLSLMEVQVREVAPFEGIRVYNAGITTPDMSRAVDFYETILGFEEWSRAYLPAALPLKHKDGSFAFMLHERKGLSNRQPVYGKDSDLNLLFSTTDLAQARQYLSSQSLEMIEIREASGLVVKDPLGNFCEVMQK